MAYGPVTQTPTLGHRIVLPILRVHVILADYLCAFIEIPVELGNLSGGAVSQTLQDLLFVALPLWVLANGTWIMCTLLSHPLSTLNAILACIDAAYVTLSWSMYLMCSGLVHELRKSVKESRERK